MEIFCTLGPKSLNKKFLSFAQRNKVTLVRLNLSHLNIKELKKNILFIKKNSKLKICIDTEGAQIRTKLKSKSIEIKKNKKFYLSKEKGKFTLYPENVFDQIKKGDILDIGFSNLKAKVFSKSGNNIVLKSISSGLLENNKGVHVTNRNIKIKFLTDKDLTAIELSKKYKIRNFCLSFTNSVDDIRNFKKIVGNSRAIFKLETKRAIKNLHSILKEANDFLIDRGDLSKEVGIENIPIIQRQILKYLKKFKGKKIAIATNFLESMIVNPYPTRAEINDIYNACEMGATGLVLAAETAIGKYPEESLSLLKKIINVYYSKKFLFF